MPLAEAAPRRGSEEGHGRLRLRWEPGADPPRVLLEARGAAARRLSEAARKLPRVITWRARGFDASSDAFVEKIVARDAVLWPVRVGPGHAAYKAAPLLLGRLLRDLGPVEVEAPRDLAAQLQAWLRTWEPAGQPPGPRPYQREAVETAARSWFSIVELPTGAGKTVVMGHYLYRLRLPALVLEPTLDLVEQTLRRLRAWGVPASTDPDAPVTVVTYQAAARNPYGWTKAVLVLDEAHHVPAQTWRRPLLGNPWRGVLALTATLMRSDGNLDVFRLADARYSRSYRELAEQGYLAPMRFVLAPYDCPEAAERLETLPSGNWRSYRSRAAPLWERLAAPGLAEAAARLAGEGRKVIVFSDYVEVVEDVYRRLRDRRVPAVRFHGGMRMEHRRSALRAFGMGEARVLVVSPAGNEGLDIPDADAAVMATVPNTLRLRQRLGRIARPKPGGREAVAVFLALDADAIPGSYLYRLGVTVGRVAARLKREAVYYDAARDSWEPITCRG